MSLRWRKNGDLLCAAKHRPLKDDTYIDDRLHYKLAVELKIVIPRDDELVSGRWHWKEKVIMSRARDWDFGFGRFIGGLTFYPYQLAVGMTIRYWPNVFAPSIRIHVGPFKLWCCWIDRKEKVRNG